ncbi:hypothetical protein H1C71_010185 [Ictidomys tridecemlineatus]|nr:hypothetical protein H1C71_010185 [Ictidomys tridecemlineatus]
MYVLQQPVGCSFTALVILSVLSTCQARFHRALRSGRLRGSHLRLITERPCVKRGELRSFSLLLWGDLWLQALLSRRAAEILSITNLSFKPQGWVVTDPFRQGCLCTSGKRLRAESLVGFGCGWVWFFPLPHSKVVCQDNITLGDTYVS